MKTEKKSREYVSPRLNAVALDSRTSLCGGSTTTTEDYDEEIDV